MEHVVALDRQQHLLFGLSALMRGERRERESSARKNDGEVEAATEAAGDLTRRDGETLVFSLWITYISLLYTRVHSTMSARVKFNKTSSSTVQPKTRQTNAQLSQNFLFLSICLSDCLPLYRYLSFSWSASGEQRTSTRAPNTPVQS